MMKWFSIALLLGVAPLMVSCGGASTNSVPLPSQASSFNAGTGGSGTMTGSGAGSASTSGCDSNPLLWGGNKAAASGTIVSKFTPTGVMAQPRAGHSATLLPDGRVLIVDGGQLDIDDLLVSIVSAELFDPSQGKFTSTGAPCLAREFHTATLLTNGKALIVGGNEFNGYPTWLPQTSGAELYDPASGAFVRTGSMIVGRTLHSATLLADGRVLIAGGATNIGSGATTATGALATTEIYDPGTGAFSAGGSMAHARKGHSATLLPSGKVLIAGGEGDQESLTTAELYDPTTNSFSGTGNMGAARTGHSATLLANGKVLIAGGATSDALFQGSIGLNPARQATAELYDPFTGTFVSTGNMTDARIAHTATLLADGTVLMTGGYTDYVGGLPTSLGYQSLSSAEIYDPVSGAFKAIDSMNATRFWHTATLLRDGSVLIAGGIGSDLPESSAEIFH